MLLARAVRCRRAPNMAQALRFSRWPRLMRRHADTPSLIAVRH